MGGGGGGLGAIERSRVRPVPEPWPAQMRLSDARTRFTAALEPFTRLSGGTLDKPKLTTGRAPPAVTVSTSQRRGHMVTLLTARARARGSRLG